MNRRSRAFIRASSRRVIITVVAPLRRFGDRYELEYDRRAVIAVEDAFTRHATTSTCWPRSLRRCRA
jgi:hypothetical protein